MLISCFTNHPKYNSLWIIISASVSNLPSIFANSRLHARDTLFISAFASAHHVIAAIARLLLIRINALCGGNSADLPRVEIPFILSAKTLQAYIWESESCL